MATPKNGPKNTSNNAILQSMPDEVQKIREIALNILNILDNEIKSGEKPEENPPNYDHIFGNRSSRVNALVTLADLLLRFTPVKPMATGEEQALPISDDDMKLVELLIERSKQQYHDAAE